MFSYVRVIHTLTAAINLFLITSLPGRIGDEGQLPVVYQRSYDTFAQPALFVSPQTLSDSLFTGGTSHQQLKIINRGGDSLRFVIRETPALQRQTATAARVRGDKPSRARHKEQIFPFVPAPDDPHEQARLRVSLAAVPDSVRIFYDDMENGVNGWRAQLYAGAQDSLWHLTDRSFLSPNTSWWCGSEALGTYRTGRRINTALLSPAIDLRLWPAPITLQFFENYFIEDGFDFVMVDCSSDSGTSWAPLRGTAAGGTAPTGSSNGWIRTTLDLSAFVGQIIHLRFYFDTQDHLANNFPGWLIDDVLVYSAGIPWLAAHPVEGVLAAGDSMAIDVTFTANGSAGGDHLAALAIAGSDSALATIFVPVQLHVTPAPDLHFSPDSLRFGEVFTGIGDTLTLTLTNQGVEPLVFEPPEFSSSIFSVVEFFPSLLPGESRAMAVTFSPPTSGAHTGSLILRSNDPDEPNVTIWLEGRGRLAPVASFTPDSLTQVLTSGDSAIQILTIQNTGGSELLFELIAEELGCSPQNFLIAKKPAMGRAKKILFDTSHGINPPGFGLEIYSRIISRLRASGHEVVTSQPALEPEGFDVLVLIRPASAYTNADINGIQNFVSRGGRLVLFGDWGGNFGETFLNQLLQHNAWNTGLAINFNLVRDPVYNLAGHGAFLKIYDFSETLYPLIAGVDTVLALSAASLRVNSPAHVVASTSPFAETGFAGAGSTARADIFSWKSTSAASTARGQGLPIIATTTWGRGLVILCGDSDFLADSSSVNGIAVGAQRFDNLRLAWNLLIGGEVGWLAVSPVAGVIPPNGSQEVALAFDASGLLEDDYCARLRIVTNDPFHPHRTVPLNLRVNGIPGLAVSQDTLRFDHAFAGFADTLLFAISNRGSALLRVSDIRAGDAQISVSPSTFELPPNAVESLRVIFGPSAPGALATSLVISSNDPEVPERAVYVTGHAVMPPRMVMIPDSLVEALAAGQSSTQTLTVRNEGGSGLFFRTELSGSTGLILSEKFPHAIPGVQPSPFESFLAQHDIFGHLWLDGGNDAFDGFGNPQITVGGVTRSLLMTPGVERLTVNGFEVVVRKDFPENHVYRMIIAPGEGEAGSRSDISIQLHGNMGSDASTTTETRTFDLAGQPLKYFVNQDAGGNRTGDPRVVFLMLPADPASQTAVAYRNVLDNVTIAATQVKLPVMVYLIVSYFDLAAIENWLAHELQFDPAFVEISPDSARLAPGEAAEVNVAFDARALIGGGYATAMAMRSNDPRRPALQVPVRLRVSGMPELALAADSLAFNNEVFAGFADSLQFIVQNVGTDSLKVFDIVSSQAAFECRPRNFVLRPRDAQTVKTVFAPRSAGRFLAKLTIRSNDSDHHEVEVPISGSALVPPAMVVSTGSFADVLFPEEISRHRLSIKNSGGSDLIFRVRAEVVEHVAGAMPVASPGVLFIADDAGLIHRLQAAGKHAVASPSAVDLTGFNNVFLLSLSYAEPLASLHEFVSQGRKLITVADASDLRQLNAILQDHELEGFGAQEVNAASETSWLSTSLQDGRLTAGDSLVMSVDFQTSALDTMGPRMANLFFDSNDPARQTTVLPCTLEVAPPDTAVLTIRDRRNEQGVRLTNASTDTLSLRISNAVHLGAFEAEMRFNPQHVRINEVRRGEFLESTGRAVQLAETMIDNSAGRLSIAAASAGGQMGPRGEGVLAWIAISGVVSAESCVTALESELAIASSEVVRANDLTLPHRSSGSRLHLNCRYWADFDGNGEVEIEDVRLAAARWNTTWDDSFYVASFDVDGCGEGDGDVDVVDVQLLVNQLKARGAPWPPCSSEPAVERERSTFLRLQSRGSDGEGVQLYQLVYEQGALPAALEFYLVLEGESRLISFYAGAGLQAGLLGPSPFVSRKPRLGAYFLRSPQEHPSAHVLLEFKIKGACSGLQNFLAVASKAEPLAVEFINATEVKEATAAPAAFALHQNYPNPFSCNGSAVGAAVTTIRFDIPAEAGNLVPVHLAIYDLQGKLVKTLLAAERTPGAYQTAWNGLDAGGRHLASGIYFVRLEAGKFVTQRKATLVR